MAEDGIPKGAASRGLFDPEFIAKHPELFGATGDGEAKPIEGILSATGEDDTLKAEGALSGAVAGGIPVSTSLPDQISRHNIADEDLDVLCDPAREDFRERKWIALGIAVGVAPSAIEALLNYSPTVGLSKVALFQIIVLFVSVAVWIVLTQVVKASANTAAAKRNEIRARSRRLLESTSERQ